MKHYNKTHCNPDVTEYVGEVVVLKEKSNNGIILDPDTQLFYVTHLAPDDSKNKKPPICGYHLKNNYEAKIEQNRIYGAVDEYKLPDWAVDKLNALVPRYQIENIELFESGKPLFFASANNYRIMAEFNEHLLLVQLTPQQKVHFSTCKMASDNMASSWWSFGTDLENAKSRFAAASGLVSWMLLLKERDRPVIAKACSLLLENGGNLTEFEKSVAKHLLELHENWFCEGKLESVEDETSDLEKDSTSEN